MAARIAIIVEGATETMFKPAIRRFLQTTLAGQMPRLDFVPQDGRLPKGPALCRLVRNLLRDHNAVVALTDVYTGTTPPDFTNAADAKRQLRAWVGEEPRFHPHAAQFEVEAWLLPYWPRIQKVAGSTRGAPPGSPETVNHDQPPARLLNAVFGAGTTKRRYSKTRDGSAILRDQNIEVAAAACPELRAFLDTLLQIAKAAST